MDWTTVVFTVVMVVLVAAAMWAMKDSVSDYARELRSAHRDVSQIVAKSPNGRLVDQEWLAQTLAETRVRIVWVWCGLTALPVVPIMMVGDDFPIGSLIFPIWFLAESISALLVARRRTHVHAGALRQADLEARTLTTFVSRPLVVVQRVGIALTVAAAVGTVFLLVASPTVDRIGAVIISTAALVAAAMTLLTQKAAIVNALPSITDPKFVHAGLLRSMVVHDCLRRVIVMTGVSLNSFGFAMVLDRPNPSLQFAPLVVIVTGGVIALAALTIPWRWMRTSVWTFANRSKVPA